MKTNYLSSISICFASLACLAYGQESQAPIGVTSVITTDLSAVTGLTSAIAPNALNPNATVIACPPRPSDAVYEDAHLQCPAGVPCAYNCTQDIHEDPIVITKTVTSVTTVVVPVIITTTVKTTSWVTVFAASCTNFVTNFHKGKTVEVTETVLITSMDYQTTYITELEVVKATVTALCDGAPSGPTGTPENRNKDPTDGTKDPTDGTKEPPKEPPKEEPKKNDGVIHFKWNGKTGEQMTTDSYPETSAWGDRSKERPECLAKSDKTYQFLFSGGGDTSLDEMPAFSEDANELIYAGVWGFKKNPGADGKPTLEKTTLAHEKYPGVKRDVLHAVTSSWTVTSNVDLPMKIYQFSFMFHYIEQSHGPYYLACGGGNTIGTNIVNNIRVPVRTLNYRIQPVYTLDFGPDGIHFEKGSLMTCGVIDDKGNNMHVYLFDFVTCAA